MAIERATTTVVVVMWRFMVSSFVVVCFMVGRIVGATNVAPTREQRSPAPAG